MNAIRFLERQAMYPINLSIEGKLCFVVGGGRVALRKIRGLLAERAMVTVIAPEIVSELTELWQKKDIFWCKEPFQVGKNMLLGAHLVFCATDSAMVNRQAADEAHSIGALVNSATDKEDCDFQVPSSVHRGDMLLTVSTGGGSPAFSRLMRKDLEKQYGEDFGKWLAIQEDLRNTLKEKVKDTKKREKFWHKLVDENGENLLDFIRAGELEQAEQLVERCMK